MSADQGTGTEERSAPAMPEEPETEEPGSRLIHALSVPITRLYTSADQPAGSVSEPWMDAAKRMALDPSIFDTHPPFPFRANISNQRQDSYYTRMHESSLQNYAADAQSGVSFQNSHRDTELGFGRSYRGAFMGTPGNGTARTEADFYTIPGLDLNGVSTDDLIRGMRAGIVKDVSIGFYGGTMRCATCQRRLYTDGCRHVPGLTYDRDGKRTDDPSAAPSVAWVHDAHLAEVSAVYDGSCPGAAIMKARQLSDAGYLLPDDAHLLEERYRIRLPAAHHRWPGADLKEKPMPDEPTPTPPPAETPPAFGSPQLRALMEAAGLPPGESDEVNFRSLAETVKKLPAIEAERERLAALADDGRQYRTHLIESALKEGVRAYGAEKFPSEQYRAQFEQAPLDFVRTNLNLWTAMGDETLKGGRLSVDQGEPEPPRGETPAVHRMAYAAG